MLNFIRELTSTFAAIKAKNGRNLLLVNKLRGAVQYQQEFDRDSQTDTDFAQTGNKSCASNSPVFLGQDTYPPVFFLIAELFALYHIFYLKILLL